MINTIPERQPGESRDDFAERLRVTLNELVNAWNEEHKDEAAIDWEDATQSMTMRWKNPSNPLPETDWTQISENYFQPPKGYKRDGVHIAGQVHRSEVPKDVLKQFGLGNEEEEQQLPNTEIMNLQEFNRGDWIYRDKPLSDTDRSFMGDPIVFLAYIEGVLVYKRTKTFADIKEEEKANTWIVASDRGFDGWVKYPLEEVRRIMKEEEEPTNQEE